MKLKIKDYIYVGLQLLLFIAYTFNASMFNINILKSIRFIGLGIAIIGLVVVLLSFLQLNSNLSPFPSPKSNAKLVTKGIYKFIRHPIYTGIILISFGYGFFNSSMFKIIIGVLLYVLFYFKSSYEEQELKDKFSDYQFYQKKSGRFFPDFLRNNKET